MATPMSKDQRDMMYFFERPSDPLYMPRSNNNVSFNIPSQDLPENFVASRFGSDDAATNVINVELDKNLATSLPMVVKNVPRGRPFSLNMRDHRLAAKAVIEILQRASTVAQLRDIAASIREDINETLMVYSLSFVITRNKAFRGLRVPAIHETFPSRFIPGNVLDSAMTLVNRSKSNMNTDQSQPLVVNHDQDFSGFRSRLENRVSYWREDYGLNAHHWHWHLVYPSEILDASAAPDRKGELFYYMHQQIVARYDMERMSVGLPRVVKLDNLRAPIPDGYYSKLRFDNTEQNTNRITAPGTHPNATLYGTRQDNTVLSNYTRTNTFFIPVDLTELELWSDRLLDGIHQRSFVNAAGERVPLSDDVDITNGRNKRGIDIIGDSFEADRNLSVNYDFYGDLHNFGHILIAAASDPDGSHGENLGVMSDSATAMRDPVFYRWHKYIDWIFQQYKALQNTYTVQQLELPGIAIGRLGVATGTIADELHTGWRRREVEASRGIDFGSGQSVLINLQHLDHKPFDIHILANNSTGGNKQVYVRLFLAPKNNSRGDPMPLLEQRTLWSEMDKFVFTLKPGQNHIKRPSSQSSITIPGELTFRDLEQGIRGDPINSRPGDDEEDFCGCGWPQHLLVPRGRPEGMPFQLFAMMTDFEEDRIPQPNGTRTCASAASYCGVMNERYPDKRPMGFPFDRLPPRELRSDQEPVLFISDLAALDNMFVRDLAIKFLGDELPAA